jgi:subtilisin family serine protease
MSATLPAQAAPTGRPAYFSTLGARSIFLSGHPELGTVSAVVAYDGGVPPGVTKVAPGLGRITASPLNLSRWLTEHPSVRAEPATQVRLYNDRIGLQTRGFSARGRYTVDGSGVLVGVADTGIDLTHADFRDAQGKTRVAWVLDLSLTPLGLYAELEKKFGISDAQGKVLRGRVLAASDIDTRLSAGRTGELPRDEAGHGTHVASIATGGGAQYAGMAPGAGLVIVRVSDASQGITTDDLVRGVQFMFDRATAMSQPIVVNLSLGTDFGPHDGSTLWETTIASYVGASQPGRVIVAAAGNSGSVVETPMHQQLRVFGGPSKVEVNTLGSHSGSVQVWITTRKGATLRIGLEGPDGATWIAPTSDGEYRSRQLTGGVAAIFYGSSAQDSPIPQGSSGAIVVWQGATPSGVYRIVFEGEGEADLYVVGTGDAHRASHIPGFTAGVRQRTIGLPASHPSILAVGCTVSRPSWSSLDGTKVAPSQSVYDELGKQLDYALQEREPCWFSSSGPTAAGFPKPEISAPGAAVIAAMSTDAKPGSAASIFTNAGCPSPQCLQIDQTHAVSMGTSMSSPVVAGAVALLLQKKPTLTQSEVVLLLQAGAQRVTVGSVADEQTGPGELDVDAAFDAMDRTEPSLPAYKMSWLVANASYVAADGQTPLIAWVLLRNESDRRADGFELSRLVASLTLEGRVTHPNLVRMGPGLYRFETSIDEGHGGQNATINVTFDGADIVEPKVLPVAVDYWAATQTARARGGCATAPSPGGPPWFLLALGGLLRRVMLVRAGSNGGSRP